MLACSKADLNFSIMSVDVLSAPVFHPSVEFDVEELADNERCTIVHIQYYGFGSIRIWASTFLVQEDGVRKKMLHAYNISMYPEWKPVRYGHRFTLVFEGLDKSCSVFDLFEDIPEPGGFEILAIPRTKSDVYNLTIGY